MELNLRAVGRDIMYQYMQYSIEFFLAFSVICARPGAQRIRTNMHCKKYNISEDRLRSYVADDPTRIRYYIHNL